MKALCLNFCSYYKPGKNEETACRGYTVVARLLQEGRHVVFEPSGAKRDRALMEVIAGKLCSACDFRKDGCDFSLDRNAPPCGGFLFIEQLIAEGVVTAEDI